MIQYLFGNATLLSAAIFSINPRVQCVYAPKRTGENTCVQCISPKDAMIAVSQNLLTRTEKMRELFVSRILVNFFHD